MRGGGSKEEGEEETHLLRCHFVSTAGSICSELGGGVRCLFKISVGQVKNGKQRKKKKERRKKESNRS